MINRLRELLRYNNVAQAAVAFVIGFVVIGLIMIAIVASTPSFRTGASMVGEEAAALSGEGRGRYLASGVASRDARPIGKQAAAADLPGLLESGDHDEALRSGLRVRDASPTQAFLGAPSNPRRNAPPARTAELTREAARQQREENPKDGGAAA